MAGVDRQALCFECSDVGSLVVRQVNTFVAVRLSSRS